MSDDVKLVSEALRGLVSALDCYGEAQMFGGQDEIDAAARRVDRAVRKANVVLKGGGAAKRKAQPQNCGQTPS